MRPFPISIDFEAHTRLADSHAVSVAMNRWLEELPLRGCWLGIGIDRLDYTKGIPERLRAIDHFLTKYPAYRRKFVLAQILVPSRLQVPEYAEFDRRVDNLIEEINRKWSVDSWSPIITLKGQYGHADMMALHRLSDFCIVSSLDDGMNLVSKEYVSSRTDAGGMLILSEFTGAAREFEDALLVNPYSIDQMADAMRQALEMPDAERCRRMQKMRAAVANNNVYRWAGKVVSALVRFEFPEMESHSVRGVDCEHSSFALSAHASLAND